MEVNANEWMAHSDFLAHYGVAGMKWGRRKARQIANNPIALKKKKKIVSDHFTKSKKTSNKTNSKVTKQNTVKKRKNKKRDYDAEWNDMWKNSTANKLKTEYQKRMLINQIMGY